MSQQTTITILVDNASSNELAHEWGLSIHIATPKSRVLLDFGQTDAFARNARSLGIDLAGVDHAVLSHAHYDHADGMEAFFAANDHALLHLSKRCVQKCWSTSGDTKPPHYIGIRQGLLDQYASRLVAHPADHTIAITEQIHLVSHTLGTAKRPGQTEGMYIRTNEGLVPDDFLHELTLVCKLSNNKIAIFSSCSHAGVANILQEVVTAFPRNKIAAYVGGLHLMHASDEEIERVAQAFSSHGVERIWCGHCTGDLATGMLLQMLPQQVGTLHPGLVIGL